MSTRSRVLILDYFSFSESDSWLHVSACLFLYLGLLPGYRVLPKLVHPSVASTVTPASYVTVRVLYSSRRTGQYRMLSWLTIQLRLVQVPASATLSDYQAYDQACACRGASSLSVYNMPDSSNPCNQSIPSINPTHCPSHTTHCTCTYRQNDK